MVIALTLSLLDEYFYAGRYTDAALAVLHQIMHSFGL